MSATPKTSTPNKFNDTQRPLPEWYGIDRFFEQAAARYPEVIALEYGEQKLTYGQLNDRSNRLAHFLISKGVKAETLVGVCLPKCTDSVVAILGILKAGGAYVPIDPAYPGERIRYMAEDSGIPIVLTTKALAKLFAGMTQLDPVQMENGFRGESAYLSSNPEIERQTSSLAYVIYTSGTTGKPKGVMVEHGGLCNLLDAHVEKFGIGPGDRVLHFVSFSFDAGTMHLFIALCSGATSILADQESFVIQPEGFLRSKSITFAAMPASMLERVAPDNLPDLKIVTCGADVCSAKLAERWGSRVRLYNAYGPTEATILSTLWQYEPGYTRPPIGRPVANTQVYILNDELEQVQLGETAELYVGGIQVARGYLNRKELTAERFIANPFGQGRLYKTGDLGKHLPDGCIDFVGRKDHQIKLRGFRIELEEIEMQLRAFPGMAQAAVIKENEHLVAFIVGDQSTANLSVKVVERYLETHLPEHMLPSSIHILDALPLSTSGKLDRQQLRDIHTKRQITANQIRPRDDVEEVLQSVWCEYLDLDGIGMTDDFLQSGGDSISAMKILARLRKIFDLNLPPNMILRYRNIRSLSSALSTFATRDVLRENALFYLLSTTTPDSEMPFTMDEPVED